MGKIGCWNKKRAVLAIFYCGCKQSKSFHIPSPRSLAELRRAKIGKVGRKSKFIRILRKAELKIWRTMGGGNGKNRGLAGRCPCFVYPPPSHAADCDPLRLVLCLPAAANRAEVRDGFRPKDFSPLRRPKSWNSRAEFLFLQDRGCGVFPHPQYEKEESIWHI